MSDVTESTIYIDYDKRSPRAQVSLTDIRKVVLRLNSKKNALITGAIIGGLVTGYLANQSLQKSQVSTPTIYGLTLVFSATGGAAAGLLLGSALGNRKSIIIRPANFGNSELNLFRQLEPFSWHYQHDIINRRPNSNL